MFEANSKLFELDPKLCEPDPERPKFREKWAKLVSSLHINEIYPKKVFHLAGPRAARPQLKTKLLLEGFFVDLEPIFGETPILPISSEILASRTDFGGEHNFGSGENNFVLAENNFVR